MNKMQQLIRKNHMDISWHEYTDEDGANVPVTQASLTEKASIIGRVGIMLLSCGTGAWRVRSSMNTLAEIMGITCTADIGLMSIEYTCFDGQDGFSQSLCLTNTGVNTSKLNRLEHFIQEFEVDGKDMSGEELHVLLDNIEKIHGLYSPIALGIVSSVSLACLVMRDFSKLVRCCLGFPSSTRQGISVRCCLLSRVFHLLPVELTLPNWICGPGQSD